MSGNAHRTRPRSRPCSSNCAFCQCRPPEGKASRLYRNRTGNRKNPARGKKQKKKRIKLTTMMGI